MRRGHQARATDEPEMMNMDEPIAVEQEVEPVSEPDTVDEEEE
jgi:hypothetical protein